MFWILCSVAFAAAFLAMTVKNYIYRRNIRSASAYIKEFSSEDYGARLLLDAPDKAMQTLFYELNTYLNKKHQRELNLLKMEQATRQEIANISHDLRTPLTAISGYLQLMQAEGVTEEERQNYLGIVEKRTEALKALVDGLYEVAQIEAGSVSLEPRAVKLPEILFELVAAFYYELEEAKRRPILELQEQLPSIYADEEAVVRVITNLFSNAMHHGVGDIRISCKEVQGKLQLRFENAAPNLRKEDIPKLFERFYTTDKTRSSGRTGLGLSIVRALVRQMDGEVSADLEEGILGISVLWRIAPVWEQR